jgi:hypothetical protein
MAILLSAFKKMFPIITHTRNIIMNQYVDKIEYIIPVHEALNDKQLYKVSIEDDTLKIVYIRLKK